MADERRGREVVVSGIGCLVYLYGGEGRLSCFVLKLHGVKAEEENLTRSGG